MLAPFLSVCHLGDRDHPHNISKSSMILQQYKATVCRVVLYHILLVVPPAVPAQGLGIIPVCIVSSVVARQLDSQEHCRLFSPAVVPGSASAKAKAKAKAEASGECHHPEVAISMCAMVSALLEQSDTGAGADQH